MNKKVIGIVSGLPEEQSIRDVRIKRLNDLLYHCIRMFKLPVMIIAQDWKPEDKIITDDLITVYNYGKLGITGARKELRKKFLESEYDKIIMFDDDFELLTTSTYVARYLMAVDTYEAVEYMNYLLNGFAISKKLFSQLDYENVEADKGEGFEDWIFVSQLQRMFPGKLFRIPQLQLARWPRSKLVKDPYSTGNNNEEVKDDITKKSRELINKCNNH